MKLLNKRIKLLSEAEIYPGMFDLPRGVFMLYVMFTHSILAFFPVWEYQNSPELSKIIFSFIYNYLYAGTIPLLFLMCGYGWRKRSMQKAIQTQAKELINPYIIVALICTAMITLFFLLAKNSPIQVLLRCLLSYALCTNTISASVFGFELISIGPLWCVVAYFFSALLLNAVLQEKEEWIRWGLIVLLVCCSLLTANHALPFCFQQTMVCTGIMYIGWKMKKSGFLTKDVPLYSALLLLLFSLVGSYKTYIDFSHHNWPRGVISLFCCLVLGVMLLLILLKLNCFTGKITEIIRWIGRNTMLVCCAHTVFYILTFIPLPHVENVIAKVGCVLLLFVFFLITACGTVFLIQKLTKKLKKKKALQN